MQTTTDDKQLATIKKTTSIATQSARDEAEAVAITSADDYAGADLVLFKIRAARKIVEDKMDPIISPIRKGLDALYALRRELDDPLELAEKNVKGKMGRWQAEERKKIEAAEQERQREAARLKREAEEAQRLADQATTVKELKKAQERAQAAQEAAEEAKARAKEVIAPTRVVGSSARVVRKVRVVDMTALIAGVVAGDVPEIVLMVNEDVLATYFQQDRGIVMDWPGVEMYEETQIAGRRAGA